MELSVNPLSPLVRNDFSDEPAWLALVEAVTQENEMGFRAYVEVISDRRFDGAAPQRIASEFPDAMVVFVVDSRALVRNEILCLDGEDPSRSFRARAESLWSVENNLSLANMGFEEFLENLTESSVFEGFG